MDSDNVKDETAGSLVFDIKDIIDDFHLDCEDDEVEK